MGLFGLMSIRVDEILVYVNLKWLQKDCTKQYTMRGHSVITNQLQVIGYMFMSFS